MLLQFFLRKSIQTAATKMCQEFLKYTLPILIIPDFISSIVWLTLNSDTANHNEKVYYILIAFFGAICLAAFFLINCKFMCQSDPFLVPVESLLNICGVLCFADTMKHKQALYLIQLTEDSLILLLTCLSQQSQQEPWNTSTIISVTLSGLGMLWTVLAILVLKIKHG